MLFSPARAAAQHKYTVPEDAPPRPVSVHTPGALSAMLRGCVPSTGGVTGTTPSGRVTWMASAPVPPASVKEMRR